MARTSTASAIATPPPFSKYEMDELETLRAKLAASEALEGYAKRIKKIKARIAELEAEEPAQPEA